MHTLIRRYREVFRHRNVRSRAAVQLRSHVPFYIERMAMSFRIEMRWGGGGQFSIAVVAVTPLGVYRILKSTLAINTGDSKITLVSMHDYKEMPTPIPSRNHAPFRCAKTTVIRPSPPPFPLGANGGGCVVSTVTMKTRVNRRVEERARARWGGREK